MLLSVIIPTCNRPNQLTDCLKLLQVGIQTINKEYYEIIVTDDSDNAMTALLIKENFSWVRYITGPKLGPAANRNNGARLASGDWLVFTDDDCQPDANWLQAYSNAIQSSPGCKAFEGAILPDDWNLLKKDMAECPVNKEGGCFWSANIMIDKNAFWKVGGFDECFRIAAQEDQDLKIALSAISEIGFEPGAVVVHPVRIVKLFDRIGMIKKQSYNWVLFIRKHYNQKKRISLINDSCFLHTRCVFSSLFSGNFRKSVYHIAALLFVIKNRKELINASKA